MRILSFARFHSEATGGHHTTKQMPNILRSFKEWGKRMLGPGMLMGENLDSRPSFWWMMRANNLNILHPPPETGTEHRRFSSWLKFWRALFHNVAPLQAVCACGCEANDCASHSRLPPSSSACFDCTQKLCSLQWLSGCYHYFSSTNECDIYENRWWNTRNGCWENKNETKFLKFQWSQSGLINFT